MHIVVLKLWKVENFSVGQGKLAIIFNRWRQTRQYWARTRRDYEVCPAIPNEFESNMSNIIHDTRLANAGMTPRIAVGDCSYPEHDYVHPHSLARVLMGAVVE